MCIKRVGAAPPHWACAGSCEAHLRVAPQSGGQVPPEQANQPAAAPRGGGGGTRTHSLLLQPLPRQQPQLSESTILSGCQATGLFSCGNPALPASSNCVVPAPHPVGRGWRPLPACCSLEQVCFLPLGTSCIEERELYEVNNKETIIYTPGVKVNLQNSNNHRNSIHK